MLSKADYAKLSASGKAKVKSALSKAPRMRAVQRIPRAPRQKAYKSTLGGSIGNAVGSLAGSAVGMSGLGGQIGRAAGDYLQKIFGSGAYNLGSSVKRNSILGIGDDVPTFTTVEHGCIVTHREYLQDVIGSVGFSQSRYPINPGVDVTFPWLAAMASNFQQYEMMGLVFEFISTSAEALNSTNTALGTVMLATQYDSADLPFASKQQMLESEFSMSGRPSISHCHPIECARNASVLSDLYIRTGTPSDADDIRFSDLGVFTIATQGMQAAATIGELWVTYKVRLSKPQLVGGDLAYDQNYARYYSTTGISGSAIFGTTVTKDTSSTFDITLSGNTLTWPQRISIGNYMITLFWLGDSTAGLTQPGFAGVNCSLLNLGGATAVPTFPLANTNGTGTVLVSTFVCRISGANASMVFSGGTLPANATQMVLVVSQIPYFSEL